MAHSDQPSASDSPLEVADDVDETALAARDAHRAARAQPFWRARPSRCSLLGYLLVYILVFIPRGTVG